MVRCYALVSCWELEGRELSKALACSIPVTWNYTPGSSGSNTWQLGAWGPKCASSHDRDRAFIQANHGHWDILDFQLQASLEEVACWVLRALHAQQLLSGNSGICLWGFAVVCLQELNQYIIVLQLFSSASIHLFTGLLTEHSPQHQILGSGNLALLYPWWIKYCWFMSQMLLFLRYFFFFPPR